MILTITKEAEVTSNLIYRAIFKQLEIVSDEAHIPTTYIGTVSSGIKKIRSRLDLIDDLIRLHTTAIDAEGDELSDDEKRVLIESIGDQIQIRPNIANALKMVF